MPKFSIKYNIYERFLRLTLIYIISFNTKNRRAQPLVKSNFEDLDKNFRPAYSTLQVLKKDYHLSELCQACSIEDFEEWSEAKQLRFRIMLLEKLLEHPIQPRRFIIVLCFNIANLG
jgi:hypothetical protein